VDSISISCGYVIANEEETSNIHEIADIADKRMYEEKARYYNA
jgi:hypothetical protein